MTPYEADQLVTTATADEIVAIPCPGRCRITRVAVYRVDDPDNGEINIDFYSRDFRSEDITIRTLRPTADGLLLTLSGRLAAKVGDPIIITGNADYDTSLSEDPGVVRVLATDNNGSEVLVDSSLDHGDATGGSVRLQIEEPEQNLYRVMPRLTGNGFAESWTTVTFVNQDPMANLNIGVNRRIYVQPKVAGTYRFLIRCEESVAMGN